MTPIFTDEQIAPFLDVDFPEEARRLKRLMGSNGRDERYGQAGIECYENVAAIIPESQWKELIEERNKNGWPQREMTPFVHDQNGEPSCVSNAFAAAHEITQAETYGLELVTLLSPISLYRFVGSRMSGSSLSANMRRISSVGILPLDTPENKKKYKHVHPHNGYGVAMPSGYEETAAMFQNSEWYDIEGMAGMVSALLNGDPVIYARSGHCILAVGLQYSSGGSLMLCYLNSWGEWGNAVNSRLSYGLGHDSERVMRSAAYGSMALRTVKPLV